MRKERELAENVWYIVNTSVNNGELLFQSEFGVWLFGRTVSEANERYAFELRGVLFYQACRWVAIDGYYEVDKANVRLYLDDGQSGHIWGDRYGSEMACRLSHLRGVCVYGD
jgi:hypothetical protein